MSTKRTYHESGWAARRWDGFNDRLVEPLSFCQFWRTVLLYATIQQLLAPVRAGIRLKRFIPSINLPGPKIPDAVPIAVGNFILLLGRGIAHGLWLLAYPLRLFFPLLGRRVVAGLVTVGEPVVSYSQRHPEGLKEVGVAALVVAYAAFAIVLLIIFLVMNWFVTLAVIGGLIVGALAVYGLVRSGFFGVAREIICAVSSLLWGAAVVAKHGVCPPVEIVRRGRAV